MARDFVKDLDAVKKFNAELEKSDDMLDSLKGVGEDLGVSLLKVADATEKSKKYKNIIKHWREGTGGNTKRF